MEYDLFFWLFIISVILHLVGFVVFIFLEGVGGFASLKVGWIKVRWGGRAVLIADPSGMGELVSGRFTGTHMENKKYGKIAWTPGAFSLFGLKVGTADSDIGVTIPPHIAQRFQHLASLGFTDIKEAELAYRLLNEKWTSEKLTKKKTELMDERHKLLEKDQYNKNVGPLTERIKLVSTYLISMEKIDALKLSRKDFDNICQREIRLIDFKEMFRWVTYWINPKLTEIAVSEGRLEEREDADKRGTSELKWLIGVGFLFMCLVIGAILIYETVIGSGSGGGGGGSDKVSMSLGPLPIIFGAYLSRSWNRLRRESS